MVQSRKRAKKLIRRGRRSGKGEKIRRKQSLHIRVKIPATTAIISTLMTMSRKNDGNYI